MESAYTRNKQQSLQCANLRLEVARHLWRLSHEFQAIPTRSYEHGAKLMDDLGRQLGGWLRNLFSPQLWKHLTGIYCHD